MSQKPVPLSVRLSQKDAAFIAELQAPDAVTMSEKVRHLVQVERVRSEQAVTFEGLHTQCSETLEPLAKKLRLLERVNGRSFPILSLIIAWLPKMIGASGQQIDDASKENKNIKDFGAGNEIQSELGKLEHECLMLLAAFLPALKTLLENDAQRSLSSEELEQLIAVFRNNKKVRS